jgi:hypothetical protein
MHDDDRLRVPSEPQELGDHVSSGGQATNYDISDRWSNATTYRDFINDYTIIRVSPRSEQWSLKNKQSRSDQFLQQVFNDRQIYDDKIRLCFIKSYSTSTETSPQSDRMGEPVG